MEKSSKEKKSRPKTSWDVSNPERDGGQIRERHDLHDLAEEIARESQAQTSNGNRSDLTETKPGGAERGGPDLDKAERRQPPGSKI